jgi:extracellular elastinolytic metalloproteinase
MDAEGGSSLTFDFSLDFTLPPTAWKDAAVTNLFYWNNIVHDVFYRYGFDEVSGNFQTNQYGHGGLGNDSVQAEAQDGSGVNNANFGTPVDGGRPRMQMYVWPNTGQRRIIDGDLDSGVITHEYAHGISNRLTGGPGTNCLSGEERMGEGWSDWLAIALTALPTDSGEARRGMGTYVLGQPNRQGAGIRPTPYSTNMQTNPATYNTIRSSAVPHGVGYVWATMLWEVYWNLVGEHGFNPDVYGDWTTGGNNLAIQLVMDGMKFQPCAPGFEDGRDAILAANAALTEGEDETVNHCLIWAAFAKRGLGWSADQGQSSSRSDGTEAFDLPPECGT